MTCGCAHGGNANCCELINAAKFKHATPIISAALVGNPNCGKTTLFNVLTGTRQRVGNWPGVTVECKRGWFSVDKNVIEAVDLPGIYSLVQANEAAIDEGIAGEFILQQQADVIINVVDASSLERHLYLTVQLLELGMPVILALNMADVARSRQIFIDTEKLSQTLGCPVVTLEANKGLGVTELKRVVLAHVGNADPLSLPYPSVLSQAIDELSQTISRPIAIRLLESDQAVQASVPAAIKERAVVLQANVQQTLHENTDILFAQTRYQFIQTLLSSCISRTAINKRTWTERIDDLALNRLLGIPVFLSVMYAMFFFAIQIGGFLQKFVDASASALFVDGFAQLLQQLHTPAWLMALLANGIGKGISTTLTFVPVIGAMYLFLALLEDSGYMMRAAFVVDRLMRMLGLPGKAFVPMIVGFGCNVPAVLAARTLENKRDRIITVMMSPFMSCTARLAIYAVFAAAFFPRSGQNIVFALYLLGIVAAMLTGFMLRHTLLPGKPAPLLMELPPYHLPMLKTIFMHTWQRLKGFVLRAGQLIVPMCALLGVLNTLNIDGTLNTGAGDATSILSMLGQWLTPIFAPMGIHADNWPATVGLLTGVLAKEVVVGTLNTLYAQMGQVTAASQDVYGMMFQQFDGGIGAFAYLLFVLLYFPCVSTLAAMHRELPRGWAFFSAGWATMVAYSAAVMFYQAATFAQHPLVSLVWLLAMGLVMYTTVRLISWYGREENTYTVMVEGIKR